MARGKRGPSRATVVREFGDWYGPQRGLYEELSAEIAGLLRKVLIAEGVEFQTVTHRAKTTDSARKKAGGLRNPKAEMHDLAGIRVITYFASEMRRVGEMVGTLFDLDPTLTKDKSRDLGADRVGYRALHFVGTLSAARAGLPEWRKFAGLRFEIQVTTILGHAWAQFEHDRGYKFGHGKLPPELERRLGLAAGLLESADHDFDQIAHDVADYAEKLSEELPGSSDEALAAIGLDSVSVRELFLERLPNAVRQRALVPGWQGSRTAALAVDELTRFGIKTLAQLGTLIPPKYEQALLDVRERTTLLGVARDLMLLADATKYFTKVWKHDWDSASEESWSLLARLGMDVESIRNKYHLGVDPFDWPPDDPGDDWEEPRRSDAPDEDGSRDE